MKRIIAMLLVMVMCCLVTACGGGRPNTSIPSVNSRIEEESVEVSSKEQASSKDEESVTISEVEPEKSEESELETSESEETVESKEESSADENLIDGMRPEFKEAMDSYEEFFDEYCKFMKAYAENPTDLKLLMDYAKFMEQYTETMEKMDAWDNGEMNDTEAAYYLEVTNRITQKLTEVSVTIG